MSTHVVLESVNNKAFTFDSEVAAKSYVIFNNRNEEVNWQYRGLAEEIVIDTMPALPSSYEMNYLGFVVPSRNIPALSWENIPH